MGFGTRLVIFADTRKSLPKLKQDVSTLRNWWSNQSFGCTLSPTSNEIEDFGKAFTLYPNPNNGDFNLDFGDMLNTSMKIQVLDALGRVLHEEILKTGLAKTEIRVENLTQGFYFVNISSEESRSKAIKMLVKQ